MDFLSNFDGVKKTSRGTLKGSLQNPRDCETLFEKPYYTQLFLNAV